MKLNTAISILAGKASQWVLQKMGRGSTLPGKIALAIDAQVLETLAKDYEVVVVTGTNGKTLTTALTVGILEEAFGAVLTNTSGANMITGIVAAFLNAPKTKNNRKIAVLEIDEASLPKVTEFLKPSLFVFTNIFRDQMDRYGEIYSTYQMIIDGAAKAPEATVLLNGDSPLFHSKELVNPVKYYGFETPEGTPQLAHYNTEGVLCPRCQHIIHFKMNTYANLGSYICLECGFKRPQLDYALNELTELTNTSSRFTIDHQDYQINVGGIYNIYNALAAVSVAKHFGVAPAAIKKGFEKSRAVFGRQETFTLGNKSCTLVLIKNPVGANQALETIALAPYDFSLSVLLNANYADGIDTSWIWDANFEKITEMPIPHIYAGGIRHSEIARRLRVSGYPETQIKELDALEAVLDAIEQQETEHAYILATYTAMLQLREILAQRHAVGKEMK
ncbi:lipid II isoglutaminyl synthase subunit MurT [Streptococcus moroccensis]|uniref:Lipid II isoglutaminyl synthase (glutamine-hydrolyzing) subunit MurT n=1 Tax=Streptococcus moroccensis TaxID=1451356 RepID=A0ABT9YPJ5_9STRE|nr:lipid II isoglutaminyl synthase subunit MurT [Streptococcus moroccensis]MDQ0221919.1 UDP-N-acetylmuramoyl-L-alanyl-D-glutamate--2,6-diaminopimelate ligase [Streptococcus moroccensis]